MKKDKLNLRIGLAFATAILLVSLEPAMAQGNLVFNGGFDSNPVGWTASNIPGGAAGAYDSQKGDPGGCMDVYGDILIPSIAQTVQINPGVTYIVAGDYLPLGTPNGNGFGVAIDGSYLFEGSGQPTAWQPFSFLYTADASASSVDLSLASELNGTGMGYRVDNISMQAVPEPETYVLFLAGLGALGFRWLRKPAV